MPAEVRCQCGTLLRAPLGFETGRALCPVCQRAVSFGSTPETAAQQQQAPPQPEPVLPVVEFLDPPRAAPQRQPAQPRPAWGQRMLAALLDPRSIQWMMMLGGGLMVLGLIVFLISRGVFKNPLVVAATLTAGSLLVLMAGCAMVLKTRYKIAGQALAFLGCILIPLNLWFYHAHDLMTLEGNLWVGGVVCCAIYVATVLLLRDPVFMYAVEGGITLTVVLLLASQGYVSDSTYLGLVFMGLALVSIHAERAFPPEGEPFDRRRFGLPLFWSGHAQLAAALVTLLVSQLLPLAIGAEQTWLGWTRAGNQLTQNYWLAGGLWLAGAYLYFYSDLVVRRVGVYVYLAAVCLVAAEISLIGDRLPAEVMIATPAVTALALTLISLRPAGKDERLTQNLQPLALILSGLSVLIGGVQHVRATSDTFRELGWQAETGWPFVLAMLLVTVCIRLAALLFQHKAPKIAAAYLFLSAASVLVVVAAILRPLGVTAWSQQAALLMLVPIGYMIAARLWRGHEPEQPLGVAAHVGALVILLHLLASTVQEVAAFLVPVHGAAENLWIGLVFVEATAFYLVAAAVRHHGASIYAATACACAAVWQFAGYFNLPDESYTILYAVLGLAVLAAARAAGIDHVPTFHISGTQSSKLLGRGAAAFYSATALLSLAFLSALLLGLSRLVTHTARWELLATHSLTILIGLAAAVLSPTKTWRRMYVSWSIALACVAFLMLNVLINLSVWQKVEVFCVVIGVALLAAGYVGRFLESELEENDGVTLALFLGSILAPAALLIAAFYHRFAAGKPSGPDETGLVIVTVLMLVTGYSWQLKAPTLIGGVGLSIYLLVLVTMLAIYPNATMGMYLAIGGALLFATGIALSIYRDHLLALPGKIKSREGVFRVLNWR